MRSGCVVALAKVIGNQGQQVASTWSSHTCTRMRLRLSLLHQERKHNVMVAPGEKTQRHGCTSGGKKPLNVIVVSVGKTHNVTVVSVKKQHNVMVVPAGGKNPQPQDCMSAENTMSWLYQRKKHHCCTSGIKCHGCVRGKQQFYGCTSGENKMLWFYQPRKQMLWLSQR